MTDPMRKAFRVFALTSLLGLGAVTALAYRVWTYGDTATGTARGPVEVEVPRGAGARQVAQILSASGLIERPGAFRLYASQRGVASRFKAGRYHIEAPATPRQLVDLLLRGAADELVAVTVPEGKNMIEVAELLEAAGVTPKEELLAHATDAAFARSLSLPGSTLEGYLFPDTYRLRPRTPAATVLASLVRRHRQVFEELRAEHGAGLAALRASLDLDDRRIVVLASIVEKETGQPAERPRIAQVFLNRLAKPSFRPKLLQTDPTIVYGCTVAPLFLGKKSPACARFEGRIRRIHLEDAENVFNTYVIEGLPPGPIANPGRAALAAVMRPDSSPYLYFVSKNDGTHQFSATVAEHEAAVVKYQRGGRPLGAESHP
jgi:UPF0755 protein